MAVMQRGSTHFGDKVRYNQANSRIQDNVPILVFQAELFTSPIHQWLTSTEIHNTQFPDRLLRNIYNLYVRYVPIVPIVQSRQPLRTLCVCPIQDFFKIPTNMIRAIAIRSFFRAVRALSFQCCVAITHDAFA